MLSPIWRAILAITHLEKEFVAVETELKKTIEVFFSYSHKDQGLRDQLETQLSLLKHEGLISSWHDRKIGAGEEWAGKIDEHLTTSRVILLLVSADFIASSYCYDIEMKRALERHNAGEALVIPIILRFCDWHNAPFGKLQALPTDGKPIIGRDWHNLDEALYDVAKGIRKAIEKLRVSTASANVKVETSGGLSRKELVEEKLGLPKLRSNKSFNPYRTRDEWIEYITSNLQEVIGCEASLDFHAEDVEGHRQIRILHNQKTIYSLNISKGAFDRSDDGISFSYAAGRMISNGGVNAWGHFKWDAAKELAILELHDLSFLSPFISGDAKGYTKEGFLQALWNKIKSVIENSLQ